jgi:NADH-quinone oxidoreductase subunit G
MNAAAMIAKPLGAYVLLGCEPEFDTSDGAAALAALKQAEFVVALSSFQTRATEYAHAILPIAPFTETAGTFVSTEGRVQSFKGVVQPLGETRPAWKVLRVLGNLLGLEGFDYESPDQVKDAALGGDVVSRLDNTLATQPALDLSDPVRGLERIADVPIHFADPLVRRAPALQKTADAQPPQAWMHGETLASLGVSAGDQVRVTQGPGSTLLVAGRDDRLPRQTVRVAAAHPSSVELGSGAVTVERVAVAARAAG